MNAYFESWHYFLLFFIWFFSYFFVSRRLVLVHFSHKAIMLLGAASFVILATSGSSSIQIRHNLLYFFSLFIFLFILLMALTGGKRTEDGVPTPNVVKAFILSITKQDWLVLIPFLSILLLLIWGVVGQ